MLSLSDKLKFIQRVFGTYRVSRDGRNVDVRCPICAPSDKTKLKLSILTEEDEERCLACHCWTCGYRSRTLWKLIMQYGSQELLFEYRDRFLPESMRRKTYIDDEKPKEKLTLPKDFRLLATSSTRDPDVLAIKKYLYFDRGLTEDDLWFYKIGYSNQSKWFRRAIFPSFDRDGELNHYVGRTIDKRVRPKYETPEGDRHHVIFNEINLDWSRQVILCEGVFDMVKCGENAVPLLGSDLNVESALFNAIVANRTPVALAMDADMKVKKTPKIAQKLMDYNIDVVIVNVPTDPGDMSKKDFRAALKASAPFDWHQTFLDRLNHASRINL